jgi:hypothetical protein
MARLVPDDIDDDLALAFGSAAEILTLKRLRDGLSAEYSVFHSIHWASASSSGSVYGEIDFIVANRYGKLLVIEQKDSAVYVDQSDLRVDYSSHKGKSIQVQVARNIGAIRREFAKRYDGKELSVDHLLYLPRALISDKLPAGVDPSRVVDASRAEQLCAVIEQLFDNAPMPSGERLGEASDIHEFLSDRVQAVPHIGLLGQSAREMTGRVSGGLATWVSRLSLAPHRLRVKGTAGSGKTQLALQELRQAARLDQQALYVCYNRPLADAVKAVAPEPRAGAGMISVLTIHEFARELGQQAGVSFDFTKPTVYDDMIASLKQIAPKLQDVFDVLVIDEGQDMDASWVQALIPLVKPQGRITFLEDPAQTLYDRTPFGQPDWPVIESPVNYRSPRLLVDFINHLSLTEEPIEAGSGIVGFNPEWRWYEDETSLIDETENAVKGLIDAGYTPDKIAILSFQGLANSVFFGQNAPQDLNHIALKCQQGYHPSGQPKYSDGQLLVETLYRFKGQAADAVILTEIDFTELNFKNRRKLFVALTRARLHVVMITSQAAAAALTNAINANAAIE